MAVDEDAVLIVSEFKFKVSHVVGGQVTDQYVFVPVRR